MKINKIAGALALIAAAALSSTASASTYNIGIVDQLLSPYVHFEMTPFGNFSDTYNFTIYSPSSGAASVTNHQLAYGTFDILNIKNLKMEIFSVANGLFSSSYSGASVASQNILSGSYYAVVTGNSIGSSGGTYMMSMAAVPNPIPVPAAVWLLGSGLLGLVGVARRKAD